MRTRLSRFAALALGAMLACGTGAHAQTASLKTKEGDYVARDFKFRSGETLTELRLHYMTLGAPKRDAKGRVTNAVLILHGTG